jgi:hypothetical protein
MKRLNLEELDPLAPVAKEQLQTGSGVKSSRYAIIIDPEGARQEVGVVSADYQLIPNRVARDVALDILTRSGLSFEERSLAFDGRRYRQCWVIPEFSVEPREGDFVNLGLDVVNSYDGTTPFSLSFIAERLQCLNGMVVDFILGAFRFRHWGEENGKFREELEDGVSSLTMLGENSEKLLPDMRRMVETKIDRPTVQSTFKELELKDNLIAPVFMKIDGETEWDFYNAFTRVLSEKNTIQNDNLNRQISRHFFRVDK